MSHRHHCCGRQSGAVQRAAYGSWFTSEEHLRTRGFVSYVSFKIKISRHSHLKHSRWNSISVRNDIGADQDGSDANDAAHAVAMAEDGSVVLGGLVKGDWATEFNGGSDLAACKLLADGTLDWAWQVTHQIIEKARQTCPVSSFVSVYGVGPPI